MKSELGSENCKPLLQKAVKFKTRSVCRSEFFQHYLGEKVESIEAKELEKDGNPEKEELMNGDGPHPPPVKVTIPVRINPLSVFRQIFPYAFSVFFVFFVTLGCFPSTTLQVLLLKMV